jgi:hypothetical protein
MALQLAAPGMAERAHREMIRYWSGLRGNARLPARRDLDPAEMKRHLPSVSLIDVLALDRFRVRLAGTNLYTVYDREITGRTLEEVYGGQAVPYWRSQLQQVVDTRMPVVGCHNLAWKGSPHISLLWLRLPLSSNGRDVDMILGYDAVLGTQVQDVISGIRAA